MGLLRDELHTQAAHFNEATRASKRRIIFQGLPKTFFCTTCSDVHEAFYDINIKIQTEKIYVLSTYLCHFIYLFIHPLCELCCIHARKEKWKLVHNKKNH